MEELIVFPDAVSQVVVVKEPGVILRVEVIISLVGGCHSMHGLDLSSSLLGVQTTEVDVCKLAVWIDSHGSTAKLIVVVHVIVQTIGADHAVFWVLTLILFHYVQVSLVVDLESSCLDLILPHLVMNLHIIQNSVNQSLDVGILISQKL